MQQDTRQVPRADRAIAIVLLILAALIPIAAAVYIAPLALADGYMSRRFLLFVEAILGAGWLLYGAAAQVLARMRRQ